MSESTKHHLADIIEYVKPAKRLIFNSLNASEVSLTARLVRHELSEKEEETWLSPIRDLPEHADWAVDLLRLGHSVSLIGKDVTWLLWRIRKPLEYRLRYPKPRKLVIWLCVLHRYADPNWIDRNQNSTYHPCMTYDGDVMIIDTTSFSSF